MKCLKCNSTNGVVLDTRMKNGDTRKFRRRECNDCGHKFNTIESYESDFSPAHKDRLINLIDDIYSVLSDYDGSVQ